MTTIKKKKRRGGQKEEATSQKFSDIGNVVPGVDIYGTRTMFFLSPSTLRPDRGFENFHDEDF